MPYRINPTTGKLDYYQDTLSTLAAAKSYADSLVVGLLDDRGNFTPSGSYPATGGSGTAGAILKGDLWYITGLGSGVTGTVGAENVFDGDTLRALVDTPGQTDVNWAVMVTSEAPTAPTNTVTFDTADPNTVGTVFTPNSPLDTDTLYVSDVDNSFWTSDGVSYQTYTPPVVNNTEWYFTGTTTDAGGNKSASIERSGATKVKNSTSAQFKVESGTRQLYLNSVSAGVNQFLSYGASFQFGSSDANNLLFLTNSIERIRILSTGAIRFNQAYTFPTADGTAGNFLKTDGAGALSFAAAGLQYFTEAQNTSAPNATIPVDSLTAVNGAGSDADYAVIPKGVGAILAAIPDNLSTGGNKRGQHATDLQRVRSSAAQVASGNYSTVLGGQDNKSGGRSSISGTYLASALGDYSVCLAEEGTASGISATALVAGGAATGDYSFSASYFGLASGISSATFNQECQSTGPRSFSCGYQTISDGIATFTSGRGSKTFGVNGRMSHTSSYLNTRADNQVSKLTLVTNTVNATPKALTVGSAVADMSTLFTIQDNSVIRIKGSVIGKQTASSNMAVFDFDCILQRGTGVGSVTIPINNVTTIQNIPAWGGVTLSEDTTNGALTVQVTGAAATDILWSCGLWSVENIYA